MVVWIVWGLFLCSTLIYTAIITQKFGTEHMWQGSFSDALQSEALPFLIAAGLFLGLAVVVPNFLPRKMIAHLVRYTFIEASTLCGTAMALVTSHPGPGLSIVVLGALLILLSFPNRELLDVQDRDQKGTLS